MLLASLFSHLFRRWMNQVCLSFQIESYKARSLKGTPEFLISELLYHTLRFSHRTSVVFKLRTFAMFKVQTKNHQRANPALAQRASHHSEQKQGTESIIALFLVNVERRQNAGSFTLLELWSPLYRYILSAQCKSRCSALGLEA